MASAYLRAVSYHAECAPTGRLSRGVGFGQEWGAEHGELAWRLRTGDLQNRFDEFCVAERRAAEDECRRIMEAHQRNAILKAREARRALAEGRARGDALDALRDRDRARHLLAEAAVHKGKAARIRHDIEVERWRDSQARGWVPPRRPRGRKPRWMAA